MPRQRGRQRKDDEAMTKRNIGSILWLALQCAKDDRQALIDAYRGDKTERAVRQAMRDVKDFQIVQEKLFGKSKSKLQAMLDKATSRSVIKMLADGLDIAEEFSSPAPPPAQPEAGE